MSFNVRNSSSDDLTTPLESLEFAGTPSEDVTHFLGAIKRVAVVQRRQREDEWMIDYVESCLRGQALRWFDSLPPATIESWNLVRRAFLMRFDSDKSLAQAPAPAAAAPTVITPAGVGRFIPQALPNAPLPSEITPLFKSRHVNSVKALILGDSGVGKSCFLSRKMLLGWVPSIQPTPGVQYEMSAANYGGTTYKLYIWDVSGFGDKSLILRYIPGVSVMWIIYDVTNKASFDHVRSWHQLIRQHASTQARITLIGNKIDLNVRRVVTEAEGRTLAAELGISIFYEMSVRTNEGIPDQLDQWLPALLAD